MIDEIVLRNVALIREASMAPSRGLTVLTGESGSGKTAFLSGLKLLVGERASADMVRDGAESLEVEGRFFPLRGGDPDDETIASRTVAADGRSRVRINGSMASVRDLAAQVGSGIDLCGQHEHQHLTKAVEQARMLDAWMASDLEVPLAEYRAAFRAAADARRVYDGLREAGLADTARLDEARFTLERIDAVAPKPGEYDELLAEARRLENVEDLVRCAGGAREAVSGEGGAIDSLNQAISLLQEAARLDPRLGEEAKALSDATYILEDASRAVDAAIPDLDALDPARLEEVQGRIAAFQGLMRSFGPTMDEVLARREDAARAIALVDGRDEALEDAARELQAAEDALAGAADALSTARAARAPEFAERVNAVLARLEMPECSIACEVARLDRAHWTLAGPDAVSFSFRPARDAEPRPLARIASGGELSRVTLAVKAVLGQADAVDTLVFDEVDAGVGGKAALAVGALLRELAQTHQVIVVTHLAQVAVLADAHFVVERSDARHVAAAAGAGSGLSDEVGARPAETLLHEVSGEERAAEIARMLSGSVDEASLAHAAEMLREAAAR